MMRPHDTVRRLVSLLLLAAFVVGRAPAQTGKEPVPAQLAAILDGKPAAWQFGPFQGGKADHTFGAVVGRPAVLIGPNGLELTTAAPILRDTEVRAVLRFTSPKDAGTHAYIYAGFKKPTDSVDNAV